MSNSNRMVKRVLIILLSIVVAIAMGQFMTQSESFAATASGHHDGEANDHSGHPGWGGGDNGWFHDGNDSEDADDNDEDADTAIVGDPEDAEYAVGNVADSLSVNVRGDADSATYQWYSNTTDSTEGATAIDGATEQDLDGDSISTAVAGTTYYYCVVTIDGETLTSETAEIVVKDLAITSQPSSGSYTVGKSLTLKVKFVGNGDVQWYQSSDNDTWTEIDGADDNSLKVNTKSTGTTYYRAIVTNGLDEDETGYASVTSDTATITITGTSVTKATVGKLVYKTTGDSTATVIGAKKKSYTSLIIPATVTISGTTYNVTAVSASAFKNCKKLASIKIGSNVTSIGSNAFSGDKKLRKVVFSGSSVTTVGSNAFRGIYRSAKFSIPTDQLSSYTTLIKNAGAPSKAKYVAY